MNNPMKKSLLSIHKNINRSKYNKVERSYPQGETKYTKSVIGWVNSKKWGINV